ncbi:MAG: GGDEF domain-containing protein [Oscillospiraceae bacterium]|nr:GGDEF domain-containing protein [Oscillospiraceae bacterium]
MLFIEIDKFKIFNDTYGPANGDKWIFTLAAVLVIVKTIDKVVEQLRH